jgi:hypothetical protein
MNGLNGVWAFEKIHHTVEYATFTFFRTASGKYNLVFEWI